MGRTTADAEITTRAARARLVQRNEPHFRAIEPGVAIGYRRGARGGTWVARRALPGGGRELENLGRADDNLPADGETVLDFRQATKAAQAWAARQLRVAQGLEPEPKAAPAAPYTVNDAVRDYLEEMRASSRKTLATHRAAAAAHIVPTLGGVPVGRLTREGVRSWHRALAAAPARLRGGKVREIEEGDEDAARRRQATANRVLTVLKAALNHARAEGRVTCSADAWGLVKPFKGADAGKVRFLTSDEEVRLTNACDADFRALVTAALLTGCRYGELTAMRVADLHLDSRTLHIPRSKSGKARVIYLTDEGVAFFSRQVTARKPSDRVFERDVIVRQATREAPAVTKRAPWGKSDQFRSMKAACAAAGIVPAVSFHVLRHTYASGMAMKSVPLMAIADQLGHADTRITTKHYAHLAPNFIADTVRSALGDRGLVKVDNVTQMKRRQS